MKNSFLIFLFSVFLLSCNKSEKKPVDHPGQGEITIAVDESFKSVAEALTDRYMGNNPNTKININFKKEDLAFLDLLEGKARVIIMSRNLTKSEKDAYDQKVGLPWEPAKFAADALVFVVPKNSTLTSLSIDDIKKGLISPEKPFIFNGSNSSNLNFIAQKFNVLPKALQYSVIDNNVDIIKELEKYPNKIGVVSLNTISRPFGKEAKALRDMVKILPISEKGKLFTPTTKYLEDMTYPFTRVLYFLHHEPYYGLGNGFIRFSCTQLGQMVVSKEGLQPYNLYRREVQMH